MVIINILYFLFRVVRRRRLIRTVFDTFARIDCDLLIDCFRFCLKSIVYCSLCILFCVWMFWFWCLDSLFLSRRCSLRLIFDRRRRVCIWVFVWSVCFLCLLCLFVLICVWVNLVLFFELIVLFLCFVWLSRLRSRALRFELAFSLIVIFRWILICLLLCMFVVCVILCMLLFYLVYLV